jgi:hypothetical protein
MPRRTKIQIMHEAAQRVLAAYDERGEPFALFLSSWGFDKARQAVFRLLGRPGDVQVRIGLERQVRIVLKISGLETVAVHRKGDQKRIAAPEEWPSLTLSDDWEAAVADLARRADLIVLFWGITTDGMARELDICSTPENRLKTIAITAASPRDIFLSQLPRLFPRLVPLSEVAPLFPLHREFDPLIARMKAIQGVAPEERTGLIDQEQRIAAFPLPPTSGRFDGGLWLDPS